MSSSTRLHSTTPHVSRGRAWTILTVTSITVLVIFMNSSGISVALPSISRDLHATGAQASWFLLSYMLVATALILIFGRLADLFGRRKLYVAGIVVFLLGSLACGVAPTAELFIAFRFLQGVGAASVITNNTAILTDMFPPSLLSMGLGINATVAALGQALGPVVGGVVVELLGWRWMFLLSVPLLLLGLLASLKLIPASRRPAAPERMDLLGALLVVTGLGALIVAVNELPGTAGFANPWVWGSGVAAVVFLAVFVDVQKRRRFPLIDVRIFQKAAVLLYVSGFLSAFSNMAVVLLASLYWQSSRGHSALEAGVMVVPSPIGTVIAALCCGWLTRRFHPGTLTGLGMLLIVAGAAGLGVTIALHGGAVAIAGSLFAVGCGTGLFMTPNTSALMLSVAKERRGIANAVRSTLQNAGYLFSTSVALSLATFFLSGADRAQAYGGTLLTHGGDVLAFDRGVILALAVLVLTGAAGAWASFATRRTPLTTAVPTTP